MKIALVFLCLSGASLSVSATCSIAGCSLGSPLTGAGACNTYNDYIACLNGEKGRCTSDASDQASLIAINVAIGASTSVRDALGSDCSAAGGITGSVFSLLLPVMMFFKP